MESKGLNIGRSKENEMHWCISKSDYRKDIQVHIKEWQEQKSTIPL